MSKPHLQFHAQVIANSILSSFSAPYFCLPPEQIEKRKKVVAGAALAVEPLLREFEREAVEDGARGGA